MTGSEHELRSPIIDEATRLIADTRRRCADLGISPQDFGQLLLPEALLAFMVSGLGREQVHSLFASFAQSEIDAWFRQAHRASTVCDCCAPGGLLSKYNKRSGYRLTASASRFVCVAS